MKRWYLAHWSRVATPLLFSVLPSPPPPPVPPPSALPHPPSAPPPSPPLASCCSHPGSLLPNGRGGQPTHISCGQLLVLSKNKSLSCQKMFCLIVCPLCNSFFPDSLKLLKVKDLALCNCFFDLGLIVPSQQFPGTCGWSFLQNRNHHDNRDLHHFELLNFDLKWTTQRKRTLLLKTLFAMMRTKEKTFWKLWL